MSSDLRVLTISEGRPFLPAGQYLITVFPTGEIELAWRAAPPHTWGPPIRAIEE